MKNTRNIFVALFAIIAILNCSKDISNNPVANQPPKTFLSIFTNEQLNPVISRQTFNWWGDDPDGIVSGFVYTFDPSAENITEWDTSNTSSNGWTFTTKTQETFILSLAGSDTLYSFWVKAIDDQGAADPVGATQQYPIVNTKPEVVFPVGTDVPETTFTVASFSWSATDLDGDDTIAKYQYVLDDTLDNDSWTDISSSQNSITLTAEDGLTEGTHAFYLRAIDLAGASSPIIRMPQSEQSIWFVKEPKSKFLIIDDYNVADATGSFYKSTIESIVGLTDTWDIKSNGGALEPPSTTAFLMTLQLFDRIFWYGDTGPNLTKAQGSLPAYIEGGGKILMTTSFMEFSSNLGDPLDFSPADSLGSKIARITRNQLVNVTAAFSAQGFPELQVNSAIIPNVFPVVPKISSDVIYVLPESSAWLGTPPVGIINADGTFVFFGLPLASLNGQETVPQLFDLIFTNILSD